MIIQNLVLILVLYFSDSIESKIMCKDENNNDIDWYIVMKYPHSYNYFYLTQSSQYVWQNSKYGLHKKKSMLGATLKQAYNSKNNGAFYAFYNDQSPNNVSVPSVGHLKGAMNFDNETGYWIIHSVPQFPPNDDYNYPKSQLENGHSHICVSIKNTNLKRMMEVLVAMYTNVYSFNLPEHFTNNPDLASELNRWVNNKHNNITFFGILGLDTANKINNMTVKYYSKTNRIDQDIYAEFIAKQLKSDMYVRSWTYGKADRMLSNCTYKNKIYNIEDVIIQGIVYDNSKDHSKWAVTSSQEVRVTCISDINRMKSQMVRAGGSLCIYHQEIWMAFRAAVANYEKCSHSKSNNLIINFCMLNSAILLILFYLRSEM